VATAYALNIKSTLRIQAKDSSRRMERQKICSLSKDGTLNVSVMNMYRQGYSNNTDQPHYTHRETCSSRSGSVPHLEEEGERVCQPT
jgi:hypothetical protein